jgi:hypothetical protein
VLLGALVFYGIVVSFALSKPFTLDEADPVGVNAAAIARDGVAAMGERDPDNPAKTRYEIAHPTLYHHLLALHFAVLGVTPFSGRVLGVECFLAVLALVFLIARALAPPSARIVALWRRAVAYTDARRRDLWDDWGRAAADRRPHPRGRRAPGRRSRPVIRRSS